MEEFKRIRTFIKVVQTGSFTAAAREISGLHSVSSVARQMRSLEEELGARLLNRNTRHLSLTEAGQRFYESSSKLLNEFDSVQAELRSIQEEIKGNIRVSLRVAAGASVVLPALPKFLARYPELTVEVTLTDERKDLIANNIDVAMWLGPMADTDLIAKRLCPTRRIVCGSASYLQQHGVPRTPEDLRHHKCLLFLAPNYDNKWGFLKDEEYREIEVKGSLVADNGLVLVSAAKDGLGLVIVPEWMVRRELEDGTMSRVLADYTVSPHPTPAELCAVFASSRGMSRKVRAFVDFLVETFSDVS
ncbi:LysR family transcriptional regulator [Caballeronia calidae]|uniref:LysR family transcriptional regulator n=1 Tax=Caballeronia calidae TaxID=1777139 RepID=A0A158DUS7_9BURK|nr:LysR family transcriptional regulator [Caballeronia calidae]SAK98314.1 LysR family transcriptional regulator [Caballeronia calidae]